MNVLESLLANGMFDDDGAVLLYDRVRAVARSAGHPPPVGFHRWSDDAVITAAHTFLAGPRAPERLVQLAAQASDEASFARLLERAVLNFLRDQARATVLGKQIRRIKEVIADDESLVISPDDRLVLRDGPRIPFAGDETDLVIAARAVAVERRRWRPDATREGPLASREDMLKLVYAVLTEAHGSVTYATLARVVARRFDLDVLPVTVAVDVLEPPTIAPYEDVDVADQVEVIIEQLTQREKLILPMLDMSSREAAALVDLGHSTVAKTQARLRALLAEILPRGEAAATVLKVVVERLADVHGASVDN